MYTTYYLLSALLALTATASPVANYHHKHMHAHSPRSTDSSPSIYTTSDDTFSIEICNQCSSTKHFGLYQITSAFQMLERMDPLSLPSNTTKSISAPFKDTGMRLSAHAEWGVAKQWEHQALFEFGYSEYDGLVGTAYDVSIMDGSENDVGVAVYPTVDRLILFATRARRLSRLFSALDEAFFPRQSHARVDVETPSINLPGSYSQAE
jgi:hypothetical protein